MQSGQINSTLQCIKRTFSADGFRGFFLGVASPLYSIPLINGIVFAAYAQCNYVLGQDTGLLRGTISGAYAGLLNTIVVAPQELIKCKMQVQSNDAVLGGTTKFRNIFHCGWVTAQEEGLRGLFRGGTITAAREITGYAALFSTYEVCKNFFARKNGGDPGTFGIFMAGTVGGFMCWFSAYPLDLIKTQVQTGRSSVCGKENPTSWYVASQTWQQQGVSGFFKGFSACGSRAVLVNGVGLVVYETTLSYFNSFLGR